jgi:hypothetical protein
MYFPELIVAGRVLCRLPITQSTIDHIKGTSSSGVYIAETNSLKGSASDKQRQFYLDMYTDSNIKPQFKVPVAVEIVKLPVKDEIIEAYNVKEGEFWGLDNFTVNDNDFGVDLSDDLKSGFWYFTVPTKNLRMKFSEKDVEDIYEVFKSENFYNTESEDKTDLANLSTNNLPTATIHKPKVII